MTALSYILTTAKLPNRKKGNALEEVLYLRIRDASKYPAADLPKIRTQNGVGRPPKIQLARMNKSAAVAQR